MKRKLQAGILAAVMLIVSAVMPLNGTDAFAASETGITPNYVISRDVPAYSEKSGSPQSGNDEFYYTFWNSSAGDYLAYDLSSVPAQQRERVIAVWYNVSSYDNIGQYVSRSSEPVDYTIEVNAAAGGVYPEDGWEAVVSVVDNTLSSRQHLVDMAGCNWIRIKVTKALGDSVSFNFDVHDASDGVSDSWLFLGDSITAGGMTNCYGTGYAKRVNDLDSRYYPIQENGGIGGISSYHGSENIDRWLAGSSAKYVSIAYGTNDAWGNQSGTERFYTSTKYMIDAILEVGKIPVLPTIPYSTNKDVNTYLGGYNDRINALYEEYGDKLVHGADLYTFFLDNPQYLGSDGVHPSSEGYEAMKQFWAETMYKTVYTASAPVTPLKGDINDDGVVDEADVLMLQGYILGKQDLTSAEYSRAKLVGESVTVLDLALLKGTLL